MMIAGFWRWIALGLVMPLSSLGPVEASTPRPTRETMEARWIRHRAMAERTHLWAAERGETLRIEVAAPVGARSDTVTTLRLHGGLAGADVVRAVAARGFTVGGGYGALREHTFRVGHMGDHTLAGLERCLAACDEALGELVGGKR